MVALHVLFSPSAAVSLGEALSRIGSHDIVVACLDDYAFGPIDPDDFNVRVAWIDEVLGVPDWWQMAPEMDEFWTASLDAAVERTVWLSRRSSSEFCGFLNWLSRNGDRSFRLVDLTDAEVTDAEAPGAVLKGLCTGAILPDQFLGARLWDHAVIPEFAAIEAWRALWSRLRRENAPIRIQEDGGLVSAPLDTFDAQILAVVEDEWRPASHVVGQFLMHNLNAHFQQTGDTVPFARLRALADAGRVETVGGLGDRKTWKVRRRPAP